jgi:hypothetical protein
VTFTATVSGPGIPTGLVTLSDGATFLGRATLSGAPSGVATASFSTSTLTVGSHTITAVYSGDANVAGSTGTLMQTVGKASSSTRITSSANPSVFGQSVTFTAVVSGPGTPTGVVIFSDGSTTVGQATLSPGPIAMIANFTTSSLAVGSHTITASYAGDSNFLGSTGTLTQTAGMASTTTAINSSANPSAPGQNVTFTAMVSGPGTPTGLVTFFDGTTLIGRGVLNTASEGRGVASFSTSSLAVGRHTITASYGGESNFLGSAASLTQTVIRPPTGGLPQAAGEAGTSTTLSSSANPSVCGQNVTFTATVKSSGTPTGPVTFYDGITDVSDSPQASTFRSATQDLFTLFPSLPVDPPQQPSLDLAALKTTLMTRLDPTVTVPRRMQGLISVSARLPWQPVDPIEPIMAAPEFPQPMYIPLRDLSPQYVLPGVDLVPPDTLGLLVTNHAFIEAYMVGLNHEMARQLLWNDYPTEQRGSYFRQFWDVSAYVPQPGDPSNPAQLKELLKDIPPIHTWPKPLPLGQHPNRTDIVQNNVVFLVRGELFKRYPNAIVYAGKAKPDPKDQSKRILDETDERYPIFRGTLPNDITFLGFNLSLEDARGGTASSPDGFFFVFQQPPSEPRFGLEPTEDASPIAHWAELAWTNFGDGRGGGGGGGGAAFQLPNLGNTSRGLMIQNSPWRLASQVFGFVVNGTQVPDFLKPNQQPVRVSIALGGGNPSDPNYSPDDPNNNWGVNSAQTAYILLRLPFRVLIHADLMLPHS